MWGGAASGKTHLLNASAEFARRHGKLMQIYDGVQLRQCAAAEFEGDSECDLLAVDNLDAIAGDAEWEAFFYRVMNRCRAGELRFLFAMSVRPDDLSTRLDDFRSRLQWGLMLQLPVHGDDGIRNILSHRARLLGINLSPEVIDYLLTHYERDLSTQMSILRALDETSLSHQRKITIPLIKTALQDRSAWLPG